MSYILVTRNPRSKRLVIITDDPGTDIPTEFKTHVEAEACAAGQKICTAWGYEVLEVKLEK